MTEHTNPYQGPDDSCRPADAGQTAPAAGAFLAASVILLVMAVTFSVVQKYSEARVGIGLATQLPSTDVAGYIQKAKVAQLAGVSTAMLAIVTWGWAVYRKESGPVLHLSVLTLLTAFLLMQLLMV